jgi:hypothetical protein
MAKRAIRQEEKAMTDLADIRFNHGEPSVKTRVLNKGVTYTQDNVVFSSGFVPLRYVKEPVKVAESVRRTLPQRSEKKKKKKTEVSARDRANRKLEGFKDDEKPDAVKTALAEDASARKAEERVT